jgi:hypothetical protein
LEPIPLLGDALKRIRDFPGNVGRDPETKPVDSGGCTAALWRVSQFRIRELTYGRISKFSLDALVKIAASLGRGVRIEVEAA